MESPAQFGHDQAPGFQHLVTICLQCIGFLCKNIGGGPKNAISLKNLTKLCQKMTSNYIKIGSKKSTSEYDIPYYVTDNSKVEKIYKWSNKKSFLNILQDVYKWMIDNQKELKKYIK